MVISEKIRFNFYNVGYCRDHDNGCKFLHPEESCKRKIVTIEVVQKDIKETANSTNSEVSVNVAQIANSNISKITLLKIRMRKLKI